MAKCGVILASHGYFAKEALASAEMIIGHTQKNVGIVSVTEGKDFATCLEELHEVKKQLNCQDGCLLLVDIYGGTPANIATYLAIEDAGVQVFSGLNLVMLLEVLLDQASSLNELSAKIEAMSSDFVTNISEKLRGVNENGNQVDSY